MSLADPATHRCIVPWCPFRTDAITHASLERDALAHAAEKPGHDRLVRMNYTLAPGALNLLKLMSIGAATDKVSKRTIAVALREGLVTETTYGLERTALGRIMTNSRRAA